MNAWILLNCMAIACYFKPYTAHSHTFFFIYQLRPIPSYFKMYSRQMPVQTIEWLTVYVFLPINAYQKKKKRSDNKRLPKTQTAITNLVKNWFRNHLALNIPTCQIPNYFLKTWIFLIYFCVSRTLRNLILIALAFCMPIHFLYALQFCLLV